MHHTGIETSITGRFRIKLHKKASLPKIVQVGWHLRTSCLLPAVLPRKLAALCRVAQQLLSQLLEYIIALGALGGFCSSFCTHAKAAWRFTWIHSGVQIALNWNCTRLAVAALGRA